MGCRRYINVRAASTRHAVWGAAIVLGALVLYTRLVAPQIGHLHAMQRLEPVVEIMAEENDRIRAGLGEKRRRVRELRQDLDRAREGLFSPQESMTLLRDLHSLVEQAGCTVALAELTRDDDGQEVPETENRRQATRTLHVSLVARGQYRQIGKMFERLQEGRRKIWVDGCQLDLFDRARERFECQLALTMCVSDDREDGDGSVDLMPKRDANHALLRRD